MSTVLSALHELVGHVGSLLFGPSWTPSRQIRIQSGLIGGKCFQLETGQHVDAFLGIPFAKPPVDELRFKKPEPPEPWEGVRDCTRFGPRCPHEDVSIEKITVFHPKSEDCLLLNVFAPSLDEQLEPRHVKPMPVMVFIHGGGFAVHSAAHYGDYGICKNLCRRDVIVVTIQYRLGFFGFLCTGDANAPGNMGLWDMTMALRWVQDNIREFGGDPNNVTLFGQSAGGAATDFLSFSPHSRDLFHKMIPMSGSSHCSFTMNDGEHIRSMCLKFALQHGFVPPWDSVTEFDQNKALVDFFRQLPISVCELSMLGKAGVNHGGRIDLTPVFDGDFFPRPFHELRAESPAKPLMTGITEFEGLLFTAIKPPRGSFREEIRRQIVIEFTKRKIHDHSKEKAIFDMYLETVKREDRKAYMEACLKLVSDMIINNGVWELADLQSKRDAPVYLYSFDYHNPYGFGLAGLMFPFKAATHCSELPYLFGKGIIALFRPSPADCVMIDQFCGYFTNFAKYGNPNGASDSRNLWQKMEKTNTSRYFHIDLHGSEMRESFCDLRPLKWRQILEPCECKQRVCTIRKSSSSLDPTQRSPSTDSNNNQQESSSCDVDENRNITKTH